MDHKRGKALLPEEKSLIVSLKDYFDRNKSELRINELTSRMVSDALNIGLGTVNRVMSNYNKDPESINKLPEPRGRPTYAIDISQQAFVRSYIRSANLEGSYITLEIIRDFLQKNIPDESFHIATLARTLDRWGFEFGKGKRTQHLKEKNYVIAARHRYLRKIRSNRLERSHDETISPEVYLDESYVNRNHSNDFIWYSTEDGPWVKKPTGNGERLIIVNAIAKDGWIKNAELVFKSTRKTGDYHGQMNFDIFKKWFIEKLLPNIPKNSIIIMDNASYHNVLSETSAPIASSSKKSIVDWLSKNKIICSDDCLKAELIDILTKFNPEPTYAIDEIAQQHGHAILRTPPYHPELQPIEICWGIAKNEVARNSDFTMKNLEYQLKKAFLKITPTTCQKIIKKIRKVEDKFWDDDEKLETESV